MGTSTARPYKIQDASASRKVGVTAESLKELKEKAEKRLNISKEYRVYLEDGTEVTTEDYFQTLPPQTIFLFINPAEQNIEADLQKVEKLTQKIFQQLSAQHEFAAAEVEGLFTGQNSELVNRVLLDYLASLKSNIDLETRGEDEDWFQGLSTRHQSKEAVLRASAQSRIRNYYHKTKDYVNEQNASSYTLSLVEILHQSLRVNNFNGDYFVRSAKPGLRMCDEDGWFKCKGAFNQNQCDNSHSINPYASKEARIVFSTWNLDHVIEKSREILPTFLKVSEACPNNKQVNWEYFYNLLFTKKNLKLVHIACHIKTAHTGKCDRNQFYKPHRGKVVKNQKRKVVRFIMDHLHCLTILNNVINIEG